MAIKSTLNKEISTTPNRHGYITKNLEVHSSNDNPRNYSDDGKGKGNHSTLQSIFSSHSNAVVNIPASPASVASRDAADFAIAASIFKGRKALQGIDLSQEQQIALNEIANSIRNANFEINEQTISNAISEYFGESAGQIIAQSENYEDLLELIINQNEIESQAYNPDFPLNDVSFSYRKSGASRADDIARIRTEAMEKGFTRPEFDNALVYLINKGM